MRTISDIFNFDNIGAKIKSLAKWSCWISILLIWIAAPIFLILLASQKWSAGLWWIPVVGAILGPIFIWIGSWVMYAFGQFVEDTHAVRNKYYPAAEEKAKLKAEETEKQKAAEQAAKREAEEERLRISELEKAASAYLKRHVSVSDITCTLLYVIPASTGKPKEMHLDMAVGDQEFTSLDLFFDQSRKAYFFKGRELALNSAWRSPEEIFGFDVSAFKSFHTEVDEDE